eukprot:12652395-Alexandrium_andersonii.AAC.1
MGWGRRCARGINLRGPGGLHGESFANVPRINIVTSPREWIMDCSSRALFAQRCMSSLLPPTAERRS